MCATGFCVVDGICSLSAPTSSPNKSPTAVPTTTSGPGCHDIPVTSASGQVEPWVADKAISLEFGNLYIGPYTCADISGSGGNPAEIAISICESMPVGFLDLLALNAGEATKSGASTGRGAAIISTLIRVVSAFSYCKRVFHPFAVLCVFTILTALSIPLVMSGLLILVCAVTSQCPTARSGSGLSNGWQLAKVNSRQ